MTRAPVPPLLRQLSSDEYRPLPYTPTDRGALARLDERVPGRARAAGLDTRGYTESRRGTAATLRALNDAAGERFYDVPAEAEVDADAADAALGGGPGAVVVDVQTHLAMPSRLHGLSAEQLLAFLRITDGDRWGNGIAPELLSAPEWVGHVFGASETAVAVLDVDAGPAERERHHEPRDRVLSRDRRPVCGVGAGPHAHDRPPQRPRRARRHGGMAGRALARRLEALHDVATARMARSDGRRLVPRRRARRPAVPRAGARGRAAGRRGAQGHRRPDTGRVDHDVVAARHRAGGPPVPRHRVPRVPLGLRARPRRRGRGLPPIDGMRWWRRRRRCGTRPGGQPARREPRGRGRAIRRERVRGARNHVVPDAAQAAGSRARPRQVAARGRPRPDPLGHRLHLVRVAATPHRRVPRVHHPAADAG